MKKVLSMILVVVMAAALLSVSVFANEPGPEPDDSAEFTVISRGISGTDVAGISSNAPDDVTFEVGSVEDEKGSAFAEETAAAAGAEIKLKMTSFLVKPSQSGDFVVNVTMNMPDEMIDNFLNIFVSEEGKEPALDQCVKVTENEMTVSLTRFGTISPVVTDKELAPAVAPATGNAVLPVILCVMAAAAIGGAVFAKKRCTE